MDHKTIEQLIEKLMEQHQEGACVDVLSVVPDAHLIMVKHMTVRDWGWGHSPDPNKEYRIPETFNFESLGWRDIWECLPSEINDRVIEFFEEDGCDAMH